MPCYNPACVKLFHDSKTGEIQYKFLGKLPQDNDLSKNILKGKYAGVKDLSINNYVYTDNFIPIPCGKCIGCRLDYSRSWADRMTYHFFGKESVSWFVTLTYDDDHIVDLDHSANYDLYALRYDDMTEFIKRLRNKFRDLEIDYFYSGEYGDQQFRPHFHMILYGVDIPDLEYWKANNTGDPIYISEVINSLWQKGFVTISPFSWHGAAYAASYVEKKLDGRRLDEYTAVGLTPEKARMSRRPGIAFEYYQDHSVDIWDNSGLSVPRVVNSSGKLGIPRYFRKLAESDPGSDHYKAFLRWKERVQDQSLFLNNFKVQNSSFDLDHIQDMLKFEEREVLSRKVHKKI